MKKTLLLAPLLYLLILAGCVKEVGKANSKLLDNLDKQDIAADAGSLKKYQIAPNISIEIVEVNLKNPLPQIFKGNAYSRAVTVIEHGKERQDLVMLTTLSTMGDAAVDKLVLNAYKRAFKVRQQPEQSNTSGYLSYFTLEQKHFLTEVYTDGKYMYPAHVSGIPKDESRSTTELRAKPSRGGSKVNGAIMDGADFACVDWFWVTTYYENGEVSKVEETFLYSSCENVSPSGETENTKMAPIILCASTFNFIQHTYNWQAAYVKNYNYILIGTDRGGMPYNYHISFNFELGVGKTINGVPISATTAQERATYAVNFAEYDIAKKAATGYYQDKGVQASFFLKQDMKNAILAHWKALNGLSINSGYPGGATFNFTATTLTETQGTTPVYWTIEGC